MEFLQKEIDAFEVVEGHPAEIKAEKENSRVRCWVGTWNNPKMTDEEFLEHWKSLEEQELLQYAIFQREKGEETGTIHFQFFLEFKNKQYFTKLKNEFIPYGCHFAPMRSNAKTCRNYCSKVETRISGPYEVGEFSEQGKRTDLAEAIKEIDDGIPFEAIQQRYPTQSLMYEDKLRSREREAHSKKMRTECRNVEVIFIYGPPRTGKTTYVNRQVNFDFDNLFVVDNYGPYMFTGYERQKVVLFDEFIGQVKPIAQMNKLLEPFPQRLNIKGGVVQASFDKVYIVSNYSLRDLYKGVKEEQWESYIAFIERIHKIIRFDKQGNQFIERDSIWEDIPENEIEIPGLTRRVVEKFEIDKFGRKKILYTKQKQVQVELQEIALETIAENPFE